MVKKVGMMGVLGLALVVLGCSGEETSDQPDDYVTIVGPEGFSLGLADDAELDIPPGALTQATAIGFRSVDSDRLPDLPAGLRAVSDIYEFTPHGLDFEKSVDITLPHRAMTDQGLSALRLADAASEAWSTVDEGVTLGVDSVRIRADHFSLYVIAQATEGGNGSGGDRQSGGTMGASGGTSAGGGSMTMDAGMTTGGTSAGDGSMTMDAGMATGATMTTGGATGSGGSVAMDAGMATGGTMASGGSPGSGGALGSGGSMTMDAGMADEDGGTAMDTGVVGTTSAIQPPEPLPSVVPQATEDDQRLWLVPEQRIVLTQSLPVEVVVSGDYTASQESRADLPAGTEVRSFLLHADPTGTSTVVYTGSVTFDAPILGLIKSDSGLQNSDALLGDPNTAYPASAGQRGLESPDAFTVSADRLTLSVSLEANSAVDQFRILVSVPGQAVPNLDYGFAEAPIPANTNEGQFESSTEVALFSEFSGTLSADLDLDASAPGSYTGSGPFTASTLPAGTAVATYLMQVDPVGSSTVTFDALKTFPGTILGLQIRLATVNAGTAIIGDPNTSYGNLGLENTDVIRIGGDGRTLHAHFTANSSLDTLRVITAP